MEKKSYILYLLFFICTQKAIATDSVITVTGNVKDNACAVAVGSENFTVNLTNNNAAKQFPQIGSTTSLIPFNITLSPCGGAATAVKVGFVGVSDGANSGLLKLDNLAGTAKGIGIQILDSNRVHIPLNAASPNLNWVIIKPNQANLLNFYARLMATSMPVSAGSITATATFTLEFQ